MSWLGRLLCAVGLHSREVRQRERSMLFSSRVTWKCRRCLRLFETVEMMDGSGWTREINANLSTTEGA